MRMSRRMTIGGAVKPLVLFDAALGGDQTAVTGGWQRSSTSSSNYDAYRIRIYASNGQWIATQNAIDFTKYKYLHLHVLDKNNYVWYLRLTNSGGNTLKQETIPDEGMTLDMNIEDIADKSACKVRIFSASEAVGRILDVDKVWLDNKPTELPALRALNVLTGMSGGNGNDEDALNIITGGTTE